MFGFWVSGRSVGDTVGATTDVTADTIIGETVANADTFGTETDVSSRIGIPIGCGAGGPGGGGGISGVAKVTCTK